MDELKIFENKEFGQVRTVTIDGEPWIVGKDVAEALGYKNTKDALAKHVDEEDKRILQRSQIATIENHIPKSALPMDFVSGDVPNRGLTIINESGVYALIFGSKLESAKRFKHWVTSEVLPSIRKTGAYGVDKAEEFMKQQMEMSRTQAMILENVIDRLEALENQNYRISSLNPFSVHQDVIDQRMRTLNDLTDQVADLCHMDRKKVLHYLYKTMQEDLGVTLNPYLVVMKSECGEENVCNLHVIASVDRFYEKAVEMNQDVIERKKIYG